MAKKDPRYHRGSPYYREGPPLKPIWGLKKPELVRLLSRVCEEAGVVVVRGACNRKMIRVPDILPLLRYLAEQYRPAGANSTLGFDRISLVTWLSGLEKELELFKGKSSPRGRSGYARRLEIEIRRISKLDQPARTIAAVEFMQRIKEAGSVVEASREYLSKAYGDAWETRYAGGLEWWRDLERLAGMRRDPNPTPAGYPR